MHPGSDSAPSSSGSRPAHLRADDGRLLRGRRSRERIRRAAQELFRERGFDATTLRAIAARAGMGASSIYRHIQAKEELLVDELAELQSRALLRQRKEVGAGSLSARERLRRFLDAEHALLAGDPDLTTIALRATTHPEARVARHVLALQDRTVGLVTEILMAGRSRGELRRDADLLAAARAILHITQGARIAWANGLVSADECRATIDASVTLLFDGIQIRPPEDS